MDVTALLRDGEDDETAIEQAQFARQVLSGRNEPAAAAAQGCDTSEPAAQDTTVPRPNMRDGEPSLERILACAQAFGIEADRYERYAGLRWGQGWKLNPQGRRRAWDELERYRNDPSGYLDKIESELQAQSAGAAS